MDLNQVVSMLENYAQDLPTRQLTGIELKKWKEGYGGFYPCWGHLWDFLSQRVEDEDEIELALSIV